MKTNFSFNSKITPKTETTHFLTGQASYTKALLFDAWDYLEEIQCYLNPLVYFEPLLVEFFNSKQVSLRLVKQLVFGYIQEEFRPLRIKVESNHDGVIYIPKIGYYKLDRTGMETYHYFALDGNVKLFTLKGEEVSYVFEDTLSVDGVEVIKYLHPLLLSKFPKMSAIDASNSDKVLNHWLENPDFNLSLKLFINGLNFSLPKPSVYMTKHQNVDNVFSTGITVITADLLEGISELNYA